jgi:hypothetical protein
MQILSTSKQQTRFSLTSINKSSKTTVVLGTAMTILEIGISFLTYHIYTIEGTADRNDEQNICPSICLALIPSLLLLHIEAPNADCHHPTCYWNISSLVT